MTAEIDTEIFPLLRPGVPDPIGARFSVIAAADLARSTMLHRNTQEYAL
ncbi:MAG TPA: hypothetical protein VIN05_11785 [Roseovarius sp.]